MIAFIMLAAIAIAGALLGGSSTEGLGGRLIVNGASAIFLLILIVITPKDALQTLSKIFFCFTAAITLLFLVQLIPLPPAIWSELPGRQTSLDELALSGQQIGWRPLSLSPYETAVTYTELLPGFLAFFIAATVKQTHLYWLVATFVGIALISAIWGFVQIFSGGNPSVYIWNFTNLGFPTGPFANVNHQATLMLVSFPFVALLIRHSTSRLGLDIQGPAPWVLGIALGVLFLACLTAAGSVAGYLIALPALGLSSLLLFRSPDRARFAFAIKALSAIVGIGVVFALIFTSPQLSGLGVTNLDDGPVSRRAINQTSLELVKEHGLFGTGAGSYSEIYAVTEDPALVTSTYVKHAHNDYLELMIEFGLPGVIIMIIGLCLIITKVSSIWFYKQARSSLSVRAASIVIFILLLHSLVDYPLRTQLGLIIFAVSLGIIFRRQDNNNPDHQKTREGIPNHRSRSI